MGSAARLRRRRAELPPASGVEIPVMRVPVLLWFSALLLAPAWAGVVVSADFEDAPAPRGWTHGYFDLWGDNIRWEQREDGGHCLSVRDGRVYSPRFTARAAQRYRLTFTARGGGRPLWAAYFYDDKRALLPYDHYGGMTVSGEWQTQTCYFTTKFPAASAKIVFVNDGREPLLLDDVTVETVTMAEYVAAITAMEAALLPITPPPAADAARLLPRTRGKLARGDAVRIVILGDSIGNDLSNAPLDALLARAYPNSPVELRFTGRGSTGYAIFQRSVDVTVVKHKPDLVVLLSITNRLEDDLSADLEHIITGVRAALPTTEILLATPHVDQFSPRHHLGSAQREVVRALAAKYTLPVVDLLTAWQDYLRATDQPQDWLLRDVVHMNERGRLVSARAAAAWLLPVTEPHENGETHAH
mgnify:CR=1 FL=1